MKKVGAILLILVLLVSTFGVAINKHYCGGHLADVSLYIDATCSCGDDEMKSDCCSHEQEIYQLDEEYSVISHDFNFNTEVLTLVSAFVEVFAEFSLPTGEYLNYKPPLIERNIPVLVQSFLI